MIHVLLTVLYLYSLLFCPAVSVLTVSDLISCCYLLLDTVEAPAVSLYYSIKVHGEQSLGHLSGR